MLRYRRFHGYGVIAVSRKEARSEVVSTTPKQINRKRRLVLVGSGLAVIGICVLLRLLMGSSSANAQIPNPFQKNKPKEQAAQQTAQQPTKAVGQKDAAASATLRPGRSRL